MKRRIEMHNLDGRGTRRTHVYDMPACPNYWAAVTGVICPVCTQGKVQWAEAGHVPGYRICDGCGRHFIASGDLKSPTLLRMGYRRSRVSK